MVLPLYKGGGRLASSNEAVTNLYVNSAPNECALNFVMTLACCFDRCAFFLLFVVTLAESINHGKAVVPKQSKQE